MRRVIPGLKKLPSLKPEVLAALLSFIFVLTIVVVHFFIVFVFTPSEESKSSYWSTAGILILLMFIIPIVVYLFFRILLAPPKSPFPDIDLAFNAGIDALQKNGISIKETPLYLVLGMPDARKIKQMMGASGRAFDFTHVTADGQALHWYGSTSSTYLFLSGVGNICQLVKDHAMRYQSSAGDEYAESNVHKGTIDVRQLAKRKQGSPGLADHDEGIESADEAIKATIKAGELRKKRQPLREQPDAEPAKRANKQLSSREKLADQKRRITHLCRLLTRGRRPVCSLNGIMVTMPSGLVEDFPGEFAHQIKSDLTAICQSTGVICTVIAVVNGLENDEGCREFVSRLREIKGEDFLNRRFGKSYRSWECPSSDHLKEISNESIENFDQYIYSIFTQHDALSAKHVNGNRDMVKFLCWIYSRFFKGLELTLTTGFNVDGGSDDYPRFAGCYFSGVGDSPNHQFFSEGIFDRVDENQGELEWSSRVLRREENLSLMSQLIFLLGLIAIAFFVYFIVDKYRHEPASDQAKNKVSQVETKIENTDARPH